MNKLKEARKRSGVTQQQLANELGVTVQRYQQMERNPERVRVEQAQIICDRIKASPERVFFN